MCTRETCTCWNFLQSQNGWWVTILFPFLYSPSTSWCDTGRRHFLHSALNLLTLFIPPLNSPEDPSRLASLQSISCPAKAGRWPQMARAHSSLSTTGEDEPRGQPRGRPALPTSTPATVVARPHEPLGQGPALPASMVIAVVAQPQPEATMVHTGNTTGAVWWQGGTRPLGPMGHLNKANFLRP